MRCESRLLPKIAIGAIVKNEAPYILEWIAYHRVLGVNRFFIADNSSNDGTTELLDGLQSIGAVEYFNYPGIAGRPPQLNAYNEIISRFRGEADWIAFIDADEFIRSTAGLCSIGPIFESFEAKVGAVVLNWAIYGSSFQEKHSDGLVIERFKRRAKDNFSVNLHYKTVVRTAYVINSGGNPHFFNIDPDGLIVQADGSEVEEHAEKGPGLSEHLVWNPLRINHYVVKSRAEFYTKKVPRGRASIANAYRNESFFRGHDRNEIVDPMDEVFVSATKNEIEKMRIRLGANGIQDKIIFLDQVKSSM